MHVCTTHAIVFSEWCVLSTHVGLNMYIVCIHICIYIDVYIYIYAYIYAYIYIYIYIHICIFSHSELYKHFCVSKEVYYLCASDYWTCSLQSGCHKRTLAESEV